MDAAHKLLKNLAILLALSLLMTAAGWSQTLQVASSVTIGSSGSNFTFVTSSASPTTEITYTISSPDYSIDSSNPPHWLTVSPSSGPVTTVPGGNSLNFTANTAGLSSGSHSAKVTLTPTAPTGLAPVSITVTFTGTGNGGGGGGSNILTASANPVTLNAGVNSVVTGTVNVTTSSSTAIGITSVSAAVITGGTSWLSVQNVSSYSITSSAGTTISLLANSASLPAGTYQGTVTVSPNTGTALVINVNFTVGGTGGNGSWTASPTSVSWGYTTNGGFASQFVTVSTTSGASSYNVNTSSTGNNGCSARRPRHRRRKQFQRPGGYGFHPATVLRGRILVARHVYRPGDHQ